MPEPNSEQCQTDQLSKVGEKEEVLCSSLTTCTCAGREAAQAECARGEQEAHGPLGLGNIGMKKEHRNDQKGSFCEQQSHAPRGNGRTRSQLWTCPGNAKEAKARVQKTNGHGGK